MQPKSEKQKQEELTELLELKKRAAAAVLEAEAQARLNQLNILYAEYAKMDAEQMDADLKMKHPVCISHSRDHDLIIQDYQAQFSCKPGYKAPETKNGYTELSFASEAEAGAFLQDQAAKGRCCGVYDDVDGQMRAIAYSNGDGNLYHANGTIYKPGDSFAPVEGVTKEKYKLPREEKQPPRSSTAPTPTPFY